MRPGTLLINEVLPAPREAFTREWIELFNPGQESVDTTGWRLDDASDGGAQTLGTHLVAPGAYLLVELERAILNNSGDTVRLLGPAGEAVDAYAFGPTPPDRSHGRDPHTGAWRLEPYPSPGAPNPATGGERTAEERTAATRSTPSASGAASPERRQPGSVATVETGHAESGRSQAIATPGEMGAPAPRAAPTYAGLIGTRYHLPPTPTAPTPATPVATPAAEASPAPRRAHAGLALGGLALIIVACTLLVAEHKPTPARTDRDSMV